MGQRSSAGHRDLSAIAPELSRSLLAWWELHGRRDLMQKPWMFKADGQWPELDEGLNPYPIHVAEVMRAARQHRDRFVGCPARVPWDGVQ